MKRARKILKWLGVGILSLLVAGALYEQVGLLLDSKLAPPLNEMISVDGRAEHIICSGEGPSTFVLDAGLGTSSWEWFRLQPLLAKAGRVCAFDRPGLGWSMNSGKGHDGNAAAAQLSALLDAAHVARPFFYVGHSLGANLAQIYYAKYPADIAGLVLLEPGDPKDLLEDTTASRYEVMTAPDCGAMCYAAGTAAYLGIPRIAAQLMIGHHSLPDSTRRIYVAALGRPPQIMAMAAEFAAVPKIAYEDTDIKTFGDTPVLLFDSTLPRQPEGKETVADVKAWKDKQIAFLATLAAKSTRGTGPVHVPDSSHSSMVMGEVQAAFVARTIAKFVADQGG
jgi:pimeloyl-ACP methyl ester carboxylesterase